MKNLVEMEDDYLECHIRHLQWDYIPDDGGIKRTFKESRSVARLTSRCVRCGTVKLEAWNRITGDILFSPQYRHPEGYSAAGLKLRKKDYRKAWFKRNLDAL